MNEDKLNRDFFENFELAKRDIKDFFDKPTENFYLYRNISKFLRIFLIEDKFNKEPLLKKFFNKKFEFHKINIVNQDIGWDKVCVELADGDYLKLPTGFFQFIEPKYFVNRGLEDFFDENEKKY